MEKSGKVYLVGAGPGDAELLTLKGKRLLETCDTVIYDRLASEKLLEYVKDSCECIFVGKIVGNHALGQKEINQIIIEKARTSEVVVRLKGGDPFVFGRGGEEALALKEEGIAYEIVPGITSAIAAAAYAGIPVTHRGCSQSFTVITGHTAEEDENIPDTMADMAKIPGTLIVLMGMGNLERITEKLLEGGKHPDTPVAVVSNGTTPWQREVRGNLTDICRKVKEEGIAAPAIIIVGSVAGLDMKASVIHPLSGVRVGITGTKEIREKLTKQLEELGAAAVTVGALELVDYSEKPEFDQALQLLEQYRWVVFTSSNAVKLFFQRLRKLSVDYRKLSHIRFAAVGSGTAKVLLEYGFYADLVPEDYSAVNLAQELCKTVIPTEKLLIPRAVQGSEDLITILQEKNILCDDIKIYDVVNNPNLTELTHTRLKQLDYLVFSSSSGVHGFFQNNSRIEVLKDTKIVCIGEATRKTLYEYGFEDVLSSKEASVNGIVERIEDHVKLLLGKSKI